MGLIAISALLVIGGLSGFTDKITGSQVGLVIFGAVGLLLGILRLVRKNKQ